MGQLKINFNDNDKELEQYVKSKTSGCGFLKDLARIEMQRERNYINSNFNNNLSTDPVKEVKEVVEEKNKEKVEDFNFEIDDL